MVHVNISVNLNSDFNVYFQFCQKIKKNTWLCYEEIDEQTKKKIFMSIEWK